MLAFTLVLNNGLNTCSAFTFIAGMMSKRTNAKGWLFKKHFLTVDHRDFGRICSRYYSSNFINSWIVIHSQTRIFYESDNKKY